MIWLWLYVCQYRYFMYECADRLCCFPVTWVHFSFTFPTWILFLSVCDCVLCYVCYRTCFFFMPLSLWLSCISLECGIFSLTTIFACAFLILCAFRLRNDCFILFFGSYSHNISENLCFHSVSALSAHCLRPRTWTFCHNSFVFSFILIWTPTLAERIAVCYCFFDFCQRFRWKFQQLCCWSCFLYVLDFLSCNKANCTYVQISYFLLPYI